MLTESTGNALVILAVSATTAVASLVVVVFQAFLRDQRVALTLLGAVFVIGMLFVLGGLFNPVLRVAIFAAAVLTVLAVAMLRVRDRWALLPAVLSVLAGMVAAWAYLQVWGG